MKKCKNVLVILLCVIMVISLAACESFASRLKGFINACTYMDAEQNLDSHTIITVKTSENAEIISLEQFIARIVESTNSMRDNLYGEEAEDATGDTTVTPLEDLNICLDVRSKTFGDITELHVGWVGPDNQTDEIFKLVYSGADVYIGKESFNLIGRILDVELPGFGNLLEPVYKYDYIRLRGSDTAVLAEKEMDDVNVSEASQKLVQEFNNVFRKSVPKVLTKKFNKALKGNNGEYTLTLDTQSFLDIYKGILQLIIDNDQDIAKFIYEVSKELGTESANLEQVQEINESIRDKAQKTLEEIEDIDIDDLPDAKIVYTVKGTGKGQDKQQSAKVEFLINEENMRKAIELKKEDSEELEILNSLPAIQLKTSHLIKVQTEELELPTGKMTGLQEAMMEVFSEMFDGIEIPDGMFDEL